MWEVIGKVVLRAAVWCLQNPQSIEAGYEAVHTFVDEIRAAKIDKTGK